MTERSERTDPLDDQDPRRALLAEAARPGHTPARATLPALVAALGEAADLDDKSRKLVARALLRAGEPAVEALVEALDEARPPATGRLARVLARFASQGHAASRARLLALLDHDDEHTQRVAINALGQWTDLEPGAEQRLEARLLELWRHPEVTLPTRRALVRTLGRVGADDAARVLARASDHGDPELARLLAEARLMLERRSSRAGEVALDTTRATLDPPARVEVHCRRGLERLLADELAAFEPRSTRPGRVVLDFAGPLEALQVARTMLDFGFTLAPRELARHAGDAAAALAAVLCSEPALRVLRAFSGGTVRYRIEWAGAGKQRGATWRCVREVARRCPELVNDPTERAWEVVARTRDERLHVTLVPHLDDPRFGYRVGDVPAASHPTLAAALARVGGARAGDVVWDPFVGSGTELVERARLGPFARLVGSDLDPHALEVARGNLAAAGLAERAELVEADALSDVVAGGVDLIITNPPMGRRISNEADVGDLLERFLAHAAAQLRPGGRIAWISPQSRRTDPVAAQLGLRITESLGVDMGGFSGTLQRLERR